MLFRFLARLLLLAATLIAVQGCGQTGPLYLPDDPEAREYRSSSLPR